MGASILGPQRRRLRPHRAAAAAAAAAATAFPPPIPDPVSGHAEAQPQLVQGQPRAQPLVTPHMHAISAEAGVEGRRRGGRYLLLRPRPRHSWHRRDGRSAATEGRLPPLLRARLPRKQLRGDACAVGKRAVRRVSTARRCW